MVEVFKTNVEDQAQADKLVEMLHTAFANYTANFDLDDCDKILRVKSSTGFVASSALISLLREAGFNGEVLPDEIPTATSLISR